MQGKRCEGKKLLLDWMDGHTMNDWMNVYVDHASVVAVLISESEDEDGGGGLDEIMRRMQCLNHELVYHSIRAETNPGNKVAAFFEFLRQRAEKKCWVEFFDVISKRDRFESLFEFWKTNIEESSETVHDPYTSSSPASKRSDLPFEMPKGNTVQWLEVYIHNRADVNRLLGNKSTASRYLTEMSFMWEVNRRDVVNEASPRDRGDLLIGYVNDEGRNGWKRFFEVTHASRHVSLGDFWYVPPRGAHRPDPSIVSVAGSFERVSLYPPGTLCLVCTRSMADTPLPCGHVVSCAKCTPKLYECFECGECIVSSPTETSRYPPGGSKEWEKGLLEGAGELQSLFTGRCINNLVREMKHLRRQPAGANILDADIPIKRKYFNEALRGGGYWRDFFDALHAQRNLSILRYFYGRGYDLDATARRW